MKRFLLFLCFLSAASVSRAAVRQKADASLQKMSEVYYYLQNYYIDTIDFQSVTDAAIVKIISSLDPHSVYISADEVKSMNEPLEGNFEGVGVQFAIIRDTLTVQETVAGGPSEKVGILAGDKIVRVDGGNIAGIGLTNDRVFRLLRGPKGTQVNLSISRRGIADTLLFTVTRDKIPINSLDAAYQLSDGVLYLKLSRFAAQSDDEIRDAYAACDAPVTGVILDLRGNAGGYLPTAIQVANQFLERGDLIVYTEGRSVRGIRQCADGKGLFTKIPVAVIIDENSASASEIVAGAVQDNDRGAVVGRRSFGKGLVQQVMPLSDGSQIRLTVARYHTPSGRVIQSPYENGQTEQYYKNFYTRYENGESFSKDSIQFPDSLKFKTLKKGRTVYGGGGIMPDVFVPRDTAGYTDYYSQLIMRGVVIEYMNALEDRNRRKWKREYGEWSAFERRFTVTDEMLEGLFRLADEKGIARDEAQISASEELIRQYMKALAASAIVDRSTFYRVMNQNSVEYRAAAEQLWK